jgi:transcriptional regulator with XRE-family HTH domain
MTISPAQCRAARGLLDWSQQDLADASGVGNTTICNFEGGHSSPQQAKLDALRRAFERAGVIFVERDGDGPGVRLRGSAASPPVTESIPLENLNAENDE